MQDATDHHTRQEAQGVPQVQAATGGEGSAAGHASRCEYFDIGDATDGDGQCQYFYIGQETVHVAERRRYAAKVEGLEQLCPGGPMHVAFRPAYGDEGQAAACTVADRVIAAITRQASKVDGEKIHGDPIGQYVEQAAHGPKITPQRRFSHCTGEQFAEVCAPATVEATVHAPDVQQVHKPFDHVLGRWTAEQVVQVPEIVPQVCVHHHTVEQCVDVLIPVTVEEVVPITGEEAVHATVLHQVQELLDDSTKAAGYDNEAGDANTCPTGVTTCPAGGPSGCDGTCWLPSASGRGAFSGAASLSKVLPYAAVVPQVPPSANLGGGSQEPGKGYDARLSDYSGRDDAAAGDDSCRGNATGSGEPHSRGWSAPRADQVPDPPRHHVDSLSRWCGPTGGIGRLWH